MLKRDWTKDIEIVFNILFLFMGKSKKRAVGAVKVSMLSGVVNNKTSKDLNANVVDYYLPEQTIQLREKINLFGLKNGFSIGKHFNI
jgi:hypothetical protein